MPVEALKNTTGCPEAGGDLRTTLLATAALALTELEAIVACRPRPLDILDATLELDLDTHEVRRRPWPPHPDCGCRTLTSEDTAAAGVARGRCR